MDLVSTFALLSGLFVSLLFVPIVRSTAHRFGLVDRPDHERKLHTRTVALAGGVAVFAAICVAFAATILFDRSDWGMGILGDISNRWYVLFATAAILLVVGLVDDIISLRGRQKLLLQIMAILLLVGSGTVVTKIGFFGVDFQLGLFAIPVTVVWLLLAINALNLIDGADGMATTAGCIIAFGIALISIVSGSLMNSALAFVLCGALAGFLVYNRPPASIFLGDAGSMMIGLFVGVLAVWGNVKGTTVLASAPVAILVIPLFDSWAAIVRRWLTGRSIYATDRGHLHHLLQQKYGSVGMLLVVGGLCSISSACAVVAMVYSLPLFSAVGLLLPLAILVLTRSFGYSEMRLLAGRGYHFVRSFTVRNRRCETQKFQRQVNVQGDGPWETVWEPLVEFGKAHGLAQIRIDLSLAWLHEGYHATWQSVRLPEKAFQLSMKVPLFAHRASDQSVVPIGRLEIMTSGDSPEAYDRISDFTANLVDLGPQIDGVIAQLEKERMPTKAQPTAPAIPNLPATPESDPAAVGSAS
ncbi:MAG: MraY family glycosyltransferase [Planctomycetota bacterium]